MKADYYHIQTPDSSMSFIGQVKPSITPGLVYLCAPDGRPCFELPEEYVSRSSPEEMAKRLMADARHAPAERLWRN